MKEFDIINYPFKLKNGENIIYMKLKYKYEFRILNTLDSKKIFASKTRNTDLFLFLEISDNSVNVLGVTYNFYIFEGPLDFYIDNTPSLEQYRYYANIFLHGNISTTLDISQMINQPFPEYTVPIINYYEKASKILKYKKNDKIKKKYLESVKVHFSEEIPKCTNLFLSEDVEGKIRIDISKNNIGWRKERNEDKLTYNTDELNLYTPQHNIEKLNGASSCTDVEKQKVYLCNSTGKVIYRTSMKKALELDSFIRSIEAPIIKINIIIKIFSEYKRKSKSDLRITEVKAFLPMYRYYILDGPFRKTWVPFGYDPALNKENYKYQIIDMRAEGVFYHLFEKEEIIKEVEQNKEWYLKEECDYKNGFFKEALTQLILYQNYLEFGSTENESELDFEILD